MDKNMSSGAKESAISRKKFFATSGLAVLGGGLVAETAVAAAAPASAPIGYEGSSQSKSFVVTLDSLGQLEFEHGLGASLPANVLSVSAFIKLPDGKMRTVSVQHIDETSIRVAAGVPNATVKVGVVYASHAATS